MNPSPPDLTVVGPALPETAWIQTPVADPEEAAEAAGLRYVTDAVPGIRRVRAGRGFRYLDPSGQPVSGSDLRRVKSLVIPPAWTHVWISPLATGHIQATGRDARGRKQYIYHPEWRRARDETKFHRMMFFGALLPDIREKIQRDMSHGGVSRERVLATLVRLLDQTAIRVGNQEYARDNDSYGLTTLREDHVDVDGYTLRFHFRGKGGKELSFSLKDRRVAAMVKRLQELPGQELFRYRNGNGHLHSVDSSEVNQYLHTISGHPLSAKDFRTWIASVMVAESLVRIGEATSMTQRKRNVNQAIDEAARKLGNTRAVCRASYVHPDVFDAYTEGWLPTIWYQAYDGDRPDGLRAEEGALLAVLAHAASLSDQRSRKAG